jgi:hypothetical protein
VGGTNPDRFCERLVKRDENDPVPSDDPDILIPASAFETIDKGNGPEGLDWAYVSDIKNVFGLIVDESVRVQFPGYSEDFDGDEKPDTVILRHSSNHYFDGSYFVVAPAAVSVRELLEKLYGDGDEDVENDIARARALGWDVYAGGTAGLYPEVSPRYVIIEQIYSVFPRGMFLLATPMNQRHDPTHMVIKPRPGGKFETVCVFQRPRANY